MSYSGQKCKNELIFSHELMEIADDMEVFSQFYGRMVKQSQNVKEPSDPKTSNEELQREKMHLLDHLKVKIVKMY